MAPHSDETAYPAELSAAPLRYPPKHVVVGVDIGMTCTGVAISSLDWVQPGELVEPVVIEKWPGTKETVYKVPTTVAYKAGNFRLDSWGFSCPSTGNVPPGMAVMDLFKFHLERRCLVESFKNKAVSGTFQDVRIWYKHFLRALRSHIATRLEIDWSVDWGSTTIEYIFSLPTSWKDNIKMAELFKEVVKEAGFGVGENCSVTIELTEAEATAVYTAYTDKSLKCNKFKEGDTLLVCDAGGGTTDLCALSVSHIEGEIFELKLINEPEFLEVGSINIDELFEENANEKLDRLRSEYPHLPEHAARTISKGDFQAIKSTFGSNASVPIAKLDIPGLPDRLIELPWDELRDMFDQQAHKITKFIDDEIKFLQWEKPELKISYLILAGGLGSSQYIQHKMEETYNARNIKVLFDHDPKQLPLTVCKGLVIDRVQRLLGTPVFPERYNYASYGILYDELYDKEKHLGQTPTKNPLDGNKYATNQIGWFIRKGDPIKENQPIRRNHSRIVDRENPNKGWTDVIVMSKLGRNLLPNFLVEGNEDVQHVCKISSHLGPRSSPGRRQAGGVVERRKGIFGGKFLQVAYELLVFVERDQGLRFETIVDGVSCNEQQDTLTVQWCFEEDGEDDDIESEISQLMR